METTSLLIRQHNFCNIEKRSDFFDRIIHDLIFQGRKNKQKKYEQKGIL
jgi:hypothetical protein